MNAAVAFVCVVVLMLASTGVAVFSGVVDPLPESARVAQEAQLRQLVMGVFMIGALVVVWRVGQRDAQ